MGTEDLAGHSSERHTAASGVFVGSQPGVPPEKGSAVERNDPRATGRTMLTNSCTLNYRQFKLLSGPAQILFQVQYCGEGALTLGQWCVFNRAFW